MEPFISSQMTSAVYDSVTVDILSGGYMFRNRPYRNQICRIYSVYEEGRDDDREYDESPLPDLEEGEPLNA